MNADGGLFGGRIFLPFSLLRFLWENTGGSRGNLDKLWHFSYTRLSF